MCIIIDNNLIDEVLLRETDSNLQSIRDGLRGRSGIHVRMVYGGRLGREYRRSRELVRRINELNRTGHASAFPDREVDAEETRLHESGLCSSNDAHILALAVVAKVRLLCTKDQNLRTDFKNKELLDEPRGRIYQNPSHDHLLRECCG